MRSPNQKTGKDESFLNSIEVITLQILRRFAKKIGNNTR